jgi:hypothetical protein
MRFFEELKRRNVLDFGLARLAIDHIFDSGFE